MMERAFKIIVGSKVHNDFKSWVDNRERGRLFINEFFQKHNIESNPYKYCGYGYGRCNAPYREEEKHDIMLGIQPTDNDYKLFGNQLRKADKNGVVYFKKNSPILKDFQDECIKREIIINQCPIDMHDYFKSMSYTRYSRCIIPFEGTWLVKIENDYLKEEDVPDGFEPMKLSEFYKIYEELN